MSDQLIQPQFFEGVPAFERSLTAAMQALFTAPKDAQKLLIISSHGESLTGVRLSSTSLAGVRDESIDFDLYRDYFRVLPENLTVYVSCCWGGYPSAAALQSGYPVPRVVGPLVDIYVEDAAEIQLGILSLLRAGGSDGEFLEYVEATNSDPIYRGRYEGRDVIGLYTTERAFHPRSARGQLAQQVERGRFQLVSTQDEGVVGRPILASASGELFLADAYVLHRLQTLRQSSSTSWFDMSFQRLRDRDGLTVIHVRDVEPIEESDEQSP